MAEILTIHYPSSHLRNEVSMYLKTKTSLQDMILMVAEQRSSIQRFQMHIFRPRHAMRRAHRNTAADENALDVLFMQLLTVAQEPSRLKMHVVSCWLP